MVAVTEGVPLYNGEWCVAMSLILLLLDLQGLRLNWRLEWIETGQ